MATAFILSETTVQGADVLAQARAEIKKLVPLGVRIPKMEVKGDWVMNGFDFSFEDWQPAFLPLGNKYVRAGERKAQVEPTETSELRIFFVVAGESITANNPLSKVDMLATAEPEAEADDDETEADDDDDE